jgi:DNA repair protein RadC
MVYPPARTAALFTRRNVQKRHANAASIICGHNQPSSGDPTPSSEGKALARLVEAGKLSGISVLDHVVIGDGRYYSFADEGIL